MEPPFGLYTFASVSFFFFDANNYFGGQTDSIYPGLTHINNLLNPAGKAIENIAGRIIFFGKDLNFFRSDGHSDLFFGIQLIQTLDPDV